jgi:hypothetical protein
MACIRYCGVVTRDAGRWAPGGAEVHCPACNPPCMLARGRQIPCNEAQPRLLDTYRAWDARGAPSSRHVADDLAHSQELLGKALRAHGASRDPPPAPSVEEYIVNSVHGRGEVSVARCGAKGTLGTQKEGGVPAQRPFTAPARLRLPTPACPPPCPAYFRTFGCSGTCVHASWGPQEPLVKTFLQTVTFRQHYRGRAQKEKPWMTMDDLGPAAHVVVSGQLAHPPHSLGCTRRL